MLFGRENGRRPRASMTLSSGALRALTFACAAVATSCFVSFDEYDVSLPSSSSGEGGQAGGGGQAGAGGGGHAGSGGCPDPCGSGDTLGCETAEAPILAVSANRHHTCVILDSGPGTVGSIWCWGDNSSGQLGRGHTKIGNPGPAPIDSSITFRQIAAGAVHTCALSWDHRVYCWGSNAKRQSAPDDVSGLSLPTPSIVSGLGAVEQLASGGDHACAITQSGEVRCWGSNVDSQVGSAPPCAALDYSCGITSIFKDAASTAILDHVDQIALGDRHSCARSNQKLFCWGSNEFAQITDFADLTHDYAVASQTLAIDLLTVGRNHTCISTLAAGRGKCWGDNQFGQLDKNGSSGISTNTPKWPEEVGDPVAITAGAVQTCALVGGVVTCWGSDSFGELDGVKGESLNQLATPVSSGARAIHGSNSHTCAVVGADKRHLVCWGANDSAQLGRSGGSTIDPLTPAPVCWR
jgi:alpha-tubulin suppressor-like RCC1 family protein